ncbi:tripartite tricarboxylate transporter substrate binding protein [Ramlibacter henchirensis]|uniref:Tripartite tricarboxylate transporter substrate binding protein n=1 Tax=Ramlibacter henchirensis TaxID=204072 RepID=A0A4Z0BSM6_9BURK|nr:tripartite tricarboxylate transporter substrate binding protein [Ramlibacter henchirensis]TFZ02283.1 tripartite tricarboxylate transporter substrate binding protein [Ramlibacter henchirensis]
MNRKSFLKRTLPAVLVSATALFSALAPSLARAAYPEQPINMIVAYGAGGGTDIIARVIAPYIEKYLGNNAKIVVHNRAGAGGAIGFQQLASAAPDGYTIGFINTPNVLTIPIERKSNFSWQGFDLLGNVIDDPGNFSVHADSPVKSLADLVAQAKANPGSVTVGTTGIGSDDHLAMLMFERAAGVKLTHVPFKGAAEVHRSIASKEITVAAMNVGEALQYAKGGTPLRNLGQMSTSRTNLAPNLPTFKEQGFDIVLASLRGIAAPKGLPAPIREQLVRAIERASNDPQFQAQAAGYFAPLRYLPPARYETELREAEVGFRQLWKELPWGDK